MLFFQIVGIVFVVLLLVIIVLFFLYLLFRIDVAPLLTDEKMPILLPLPIPTKNRPIVMRVLVWLFDIRKWQLKQNWHFIRENGDEIVLPKDFKFDGASIPRIFWAILSPVGLLLIPGLIHDYGYRFNQLWCKNASGQIEPYMENVGRRAWDDLFRDVGMQVNGFAVIDHIAWIGIRVGGFCAWHKHRQENETPEAPVI
jgi:hypothetical protein